MTTLVAGNVLVATGTGNQMTPWGILAARQSIYVAKNGSDTAGNGTPQFPYLTIAQAQTAAAALTPSPTNRIAIKVGAGNWSENISLLANVSIVGDSELCVNLSGNWDIKNASWAGAADNRSSVESVRFTSGSAIALDFTFGSTSTAGKVYLYNSRLPAAGVVITSNNLTNQIEAEACHAFGDITISGGTVNMIATEIDGTTTVTDTAATLAVANFRNCTLAAVSATKAFSGTTLVLTGSSVAITLTTVGAVALTTDQLPPNASLTLDGTTVITYIAGSLGYGYVPATPANWVAAAPTNIQNALDRIAAVVSVGGGTPIP